jgi:hypothetical protein
MLDLSRPYTISSSGNDGPTRLAVHGSAALSRQLSYCATPLSHASWPSRGTEAVYLHQGDGKNVLISSSVGIVAGSEVTCESHSRAVTQSAYPAYLRSKGSWLSRLGLTTWVNFVVMLTSVYRAASTLRRRNRSWAFGNPMVLFDHCPGSLPVSY